MILFEPFSLVFDRRTSPRIVHIDYMEFHQMVKTFHFHYSLMYMKIALVSSVDSSLTSSNRLAAGNSTDEDEFCRITIDTLTNSYKIDPPAKPRMSTGRQTRSVSHSLLNTIYMEGKSILSSKSKE